MTKLITIPKFAAATGLPYRLWSSPDWNGPDSVCRVGRRRRIDVRWVEQWLATAVTVRTEDAAAQPELNENIRSPGDADHC